MGVRSFLLVIFYDRGYVIDSGMITFIVNRIGDSVFILAAGLLISVGYWGFDSFFFSVVGVVFFIGCITKRAQLPFSSWLPAAMSAPTPVSSLVHSSTLVTAGVYLLFRFNFFVVGWGFSFVSLLTLFVGSLGACLEMDFKKVVAISTLSHLGFIIYGLSFGFVLLSFMHIVFHAFFKSMLFLSCGILMGGLRGGQDSRFFGGFFFNSYSSSFFMLSSVCLVGFPFLIGFYSKDFVLLSITVTSSVLFFFVFFVSCCFTVVYVTRIVLGAFFQG